MTLDELQTRPVTTNAAMALLTACPWVVFTSGKRSWAEQAHAMAVNVAHKRDWVGQVYKNEPELQAWVDAHPEVTTIDGLSTGLYFVLMGLDKGRLDRFAHPGGRAFDLQEPYRQWQDPTATTIQALAGLERFLRGEGGLPIWHCQFTES